MVVTVTHREDTHSPRAKVLDRAKELTCGPRNQTYGDPYDNMSDTAKLWSAYLGVDVLPHQVAVCMALIKVARTMKTPNHMDSHDDAAAFMAMAYECVLEEEKRAADKTDQP